MPKHEQMIHIWTVLYRTVLTVLSNYEQKKYLMAVRIRPAKIDIENLKKENQKNKTEKTVLWVILAV